MKFFIMIIFLYGPDTYRSRQKLREIIEHYKKIHQSGLNLKYFDGKTLNYQDFQDEIQTTSMFKEKKLIILKNVFSNEKLKEKFIKNGKQFSTSKDIILFYEEREISQNDPLLNFLKKQGKFQEFKLLDGLKLKHWIREEFKGYGAKIKPEAIEKLINFVGNDLWQLSNEIKKLVNYKKNRKIETRDIEILVRPKIDTDIFKTVDALVLRNRKQAIFLIHKHLEKGDSPLYLLHMISLQFQNLLVIRDLLERGKFYPPILKQTKLHPYIIKKSYYQAKKFTIEELKKIYRKIFKLELAIKTGKIEPQIALDLLIAEL